MSTPSQPSSIAIAASEAVPTPASTMTGTFTASRMSRMLCGLRMPRPEPMGAASGITAAQPASSSLRAVMGSSDGVGQDGEAFLHQDPRGLRRLLHVGEERLLVAEHLELHPLAHAQLLGARRQVRTASSAV